ncbi:MAG: hypothetical protein ABDH91_04095 [Bacteroidia bacterium]
MDIARGGAEAYALRLRAADQTLGHVGGNRHIGTGTITPLSLLRVAREGALDLILQSAGES